MVGLARQWQAIEAWAAAGKLGVLRALIRDDDLDPPGTPRHGDLPDQWSKSLTHELAAALAMPAPSADKLLSPAVSLQVRLPGIGALLAAGKVTYAKAKAVGEAFELLSEESAAAAEAMILDRLPGKTYGRVERLAGAFAGTRMDQFRAAAYLDLLNGVSAADRIASGQLVADRDGDPADAWDRGCDPDGRDCSCAECDGGCLPPEDGEYGDDRPGPDDGDDGPGDDGLEGGPDGGGFPDCPRGVGSGDEHPAEPGVRPRLTDLVIPLATLLGISERAGEGHGLGVLDPSLCRDLAASAITSPHTTLCVTVTGPDGIAIGHGCARRKTNQAASPAAALPSRLNLTITAALLSEVAGCGPPGTPDPAGWALTPRGAPGPPGDPPWCRPWTLSLPGGAELVVRLEPLPTADCDHRYQSHAYQPGDKLRHLVQIRDCECTFPPCSRHARESDFEHATPYHKGGKTCCCNAGARSRQCHQVKQSPGWNVSQPEPGWHRWETPSGRVYTQEPWRYPA